MDLRRARTWEWLTALSGLLLLVSLFLPWYGSGGETATGWESFTVIDVILAFAALAAIGLLVVTATQRTAGVPQAWTACLFWVALLAAILAVVRLFNTPVPSGVDVTREIGVWLGTASALGMLVFDWRSMRDKSFPVAMRPHLDIETIPAPPADGARRDAP